MTNTLPFYSAKDPLSTVTFPKKAETIIDIDPVELSAPKSC